MYRMLFVGFLMVVALNFSTGMAGAQLDVQSDPSGSTLDSKTATQMFLTIAAEEQQVAPIALGQLAAKLASNGKVKEFGSKMVEDHKKVRREAEELASRHKVSLPTKLTPEDKKR